MLDIDEMSSKEIHELLHQVGYGHLGCIHEGKPYVMPMQYYLEDADTYVVMQQNFRERGIDQIKQEVSESAGWILITSKDNSVATLLETGRRMQRLFLKVREKNIVIHPMTQILEEPSTRRTLNQSIGISENIQFILRVGYVKDYPPPVSLSRPIGLYVHDEIVTFKAIFCLISIKRSLTDQNYVRQHII